MVISVSGDDTDLKKMLTANYIAQKDYAKALEIADAIAQKTKQKEDYDMAGSISYLLGDYKKASGVEFVSFPEADYKKAASVRGVIINKLKDKYISSKMIQALDSETK
jgi:hypothetical protein